MPDDTSKPIGEQDGLAALRDEVRRDLDTMAYPFKRWMPEHAARNGERLLDVLIVGGGQAGISIAAGLKRDQVDNILVIEAAPRGKEGPWSTFARMPTLRSPKYLTGPDLGIPSLTFRRWYEARHGAAAWDALDKIPTPDWQNYMLWLRDVLDLPVENGTALTAIAHNGEHFELTVEASGNHRVVNARKLVMATGIDGSGEWHVPGIVSASLPKGLYAHASDPDIDFAALKGKRVAVLGAGASAFDQAATALEAGAGSVHLFTRRDRLHNVQPYKFLEKSGFLGGYADLPDLWRWRFMHHILKLREPPPVETVRRTARHDNFTLVTGAPWNGLSCDAGGTVAIDTPKGRFTADFVICGTGFEVALEKRVEFAGFADKIARWSDRFSPPRGEENSALAAYPYLGPGFELQERVPGTLPWLSDIHVFTFGSTVSLGFSGGGMNGLRFALPRAIRAVTNGLFRADAARHLDALKAYDTPEFDQDEIHNII